MVLGGQVAGVLAVVTSNGALPLSQAAKLITEAGAEDPEEDEFSLVEAGHAGALVCRIISRWVDFDGPDKPAAAWKQSGLSLASFLPKVCQAPALVAMCVYTAEVATPLFCSSASVFVFGLLAALCDALLV